MNPISYCVDTSYRIVVFLGRAGTRCGRTAGMAGQGSCERQPEVVDRWFRALDQRRVRIGLHEWLLQVTGIYTDQDDVWIQIADGAAPGGSVLLRVSVRTPIDHALQALAQRLHANAPAHPTIITATVPPASTPDRRMQLAAHH